jgi:hypothetical protein
MTDEPDTAYAFPVPIRPGEVEKLERWITVLVTAGEHACAALLRRELEERKARELRH